jgi:Ca-activated chloride channel family protein
MTGYCLLITCSQAASPDTALDAYQKGSFRSSQAQYSQLAKEKPEDARLRFNAGAAAYKNNDLTNAANWFESVVGAPDLNLQQQAYYNLGNTRYKLGEASPDPQARMQEWQQSLQHLGSALKLNAADTNAANNLAFVQRRLEELKKQMPPPQQKQQGKDDKDEKKDESEDQQQQQAQNDSQQQDKSDQQQKDQQNGDQQQQAKSDSQKQEGDEQSKGEQSEQQQQAQAEQEQKAAEEAEKKAQQAQAQQSGEEQGQNKEGTGNESFAEQQGKPGEMSVVQAERMLDQQKGNEKAMVFRAAGGSGKEAAQRSQRNRKQW